MTVADVIAEARNLLDDVPEARWTPEILWNYLEDAQRELLRIRPALFYTTSDTMAAIAAITDKTDELVLDENVRHPLALLVAASALSEDAADTNNMKLADMYIDKARKLVGVQ